LASFFNVHSFWEKQHSGIIQNEGKTSIAIETANCSRKFNPIVGSALQAGRVVRYGLRQIHCANFYGSLSEASGKAQKKDAFG